MTSVLSSFFSRDPRAAFPYEIPSESICVHHGVMLGNSHKKSEHAEKATCFWSGAFDSSLKNQTQKLKTLRHPNVLTFLDSLEIDGTFYLITEPCVPIHVYFEQNKITESRLELLTSWGLYQILNCLKFFHNEVKISQNNIHESIYVTSSGDWKLSGFHRTEDFRSPKADLNALADVVWQIFYGFGTEIPMTKPIDKIPRRMHPLFKRLDSKGKIVFPTADVLSEARASGGFLKNKFVDTLLFLDEFQLKDSSEKQTFFMGLKDSLDLFPDDIAKYKILPKLIHTYEYGDAGSHVLIPMFKLGRLLDEDEYQHRIVPCLVKLFSSPDRSTRVKLLERIDEFAPHLKPQIVNEKIYANLVSGFMDTNPAVRESTVKAMVSFAEKLNHANLNTDLMKYMARLQGSDDQPGIRTNTTICLGKIGCYLDPSHRQRILINAFTRALKDPFPPARMAGVLALSATQQYYSLVEVANRVLPALSPLTVDPDKQVRDQGFKALSGFIEKLEKASENPEIIPELEAQVKAGGRASILSSDKVPQWAGWALKTLSGKFYKSVPTAQPAAANPNGQPNTTVTPSIPSSSTPTPSGVVENGNAQNALDDLFSSNAPSARSSATPSPTPSFDSRQPFKPAKKPLVLKKVTKKESDLIDFGDDMGWGDLDGVKLTDSSPKTSTVDIQWGDPVAIPKMPPPPKPTSFVNSASAKNDKKDGNDSDGDWDTKW